MVVSQLQVGVISEDFHRRCSLHHCLDDHRLLRIGDDYRTHGLLDHQAAVLVKKSSIHCLTWPIVLSGDQVQWFDFITFCAVYPLNLTLESPTPLGYHNFFLLLLFLLIRCPNARHQKLKLSTEQWTVEQVVQSLSLRLVPKFNEIRDHFIMCTP